MAEHALLSASSSHRWLRCPPCVKLEQELPEKTSSYAAEGTLAHELGEINLRHNLGEMTTRTFNSRLKKIQKNELFTADMPDYVEMYIDTCMEKFSEAKAKTLDAIFRVEQKLDFSEWVPEGFGTGDFVTIADGTMEICDLKYGKGIPVSAEGNPQMRLYALGAISEFSFLYDIENVRMTIIQPRLDIISTDEISVKDLLEWAEKVLKPTAQLAFKGEGEFKAGEHCGFCRAKTICKARANKNLELARYEFRTTDTLSEKDIADILGKAEELVKWAKDIQDYALEQALQGVSYRGWKIVEGRSNRKYKDIEKVAEILLTNEYTEDKIYKPKELQGLTNMEKIVGKKKLNELIGNFIEKPPGKPTLVVESDKRPEISSINSAIQDFQEV
ncbi:DUF2800 domain-containing protein [Clostridium kluyveri]|uniref:DUF2800 domain-containing protein n=1 Tax=Clostridium kluyveri TaxID=1534 RepID=UPI0022462B2F|nr:DUF2800 domain-containing protein [Clostridium kluyveri]UZQ49088.1 DUF2800 domain-containing protein [Clostridium kluyveri]